MASGSYLDEARNAALAFGDSLLGFARPRLRIGVTVARMLAMAHGARIVAVPTLTAIAQNALHLPAPPQQVAVVTRDLDYLARSAEREPSRRIEREAAHMLEPRIGIRGKIGVITEDLLG